MKIHDRIESGEMPPEEASRARAAESKTAVTKLAQALADQGRAGPARCRAAAHRCAPADARPSTRTRSATCSTCRASRCRTMLPADGSAHGFDKNSEALDISHVNLAKYVEAADQTLDLAIATQAEPPDSANSAASRWPTAAAS